MTERLLISPDYGAAHLLWRVDGRVPVGIDKLPLRPTTREAFRAWQKQWDELARQDMAAEPVPGVHGPRGDPVPADVWDAHDREGRRLWVELRQELGPAWEVGYRGDAGVQWSPDGPIEQRP